MKRPVAANALLILCTLLAALIPVAAPVDGMLRGTASAQTSAAEWPWKVTRPASAAQAVARELRSPALTPLAAAAPEFRSPAFTPRAASGRPLGPTPLRTPSGALAAAPLAPVAAGNSTTTLAQPDDVTDTEASATSLASLGGSTPLDSVDSPLLQMNPAAPSTVVLSSTAAVIASGVLSSTMSVTASGVLTSTTAQSETLALGAMMDEVEPLPTPDPARITPGPAEDPAPTPLPRSLIVGAGSANCSYQRLEPISVSAPWAALHPDAAASFTRIRAEVLARTGSDVLGVLSDALRAPDYITDKPGVSDFSWHKAGRAVDLSVVGPFRLVPELISEQGGVYQYFRVYVKNVDLTALFLAHGWERIPRQGDVDEWWHFEYHPGGLTWAMAMRQVWPVEMLMDSFPDIAWRGCPRSVVLPSHPRPAPLLPPPPVARQSPPPPAVRQSPPAPVVLQSPPQAPPVSAPAPAAPAPTATAPVLTLAPPTPSTAPPAPPTATTTPTPLPPATATPTALPLVTPTSTVAPATEAPSPSPTATEAPSPSPSAVEAPSAATPATEAPVIALTPAPVIAPTPTAAPPTPTRIIAPPTATRIPVVEPSPTPADVPPVEPSPTEIPPAPPTPADAPIIAPATRTPRVPTPTVTRTPRVPTPTRTPVVEPAPAEAPPAAPTATSLRLTLVTPTRAPAEPSPTAQAPLAAPKATPTRSRRSATPTPTVRARSATPTPEQVAPELAPAEPASTPADGTDAPSVTLSAVPMEQITTAVAKPRRSKPKAGTPKSAPTAP